MPENRDERPLKLVTEFNQQNSENQFGWQYMDDSTVLERKKINVCVYSNSDNAPWGVIITVYDFSSYQTVAYVQQCYNEDAKTPTVFRTHFSEIENKQCLRDAHRALTALGGHPPPLDAILEHDVMNKRSISVSAPLKLKTPNP